MARGHHTYSRLLCWQALDCAVSLAGAGAIDGDAAMWASERDAIRREVLDGGWNPELGAFAATIGGAELDASVLIAPAIDVLPPDDPRCRATRDVVTRRLGDHGLLHRYRYDDGIAEPEQGAFLLCTLWLADAHTLDGDPERGEELLDRVLATANDLGLLAEEADPATGEPLGNFPLGLTHLGVIDTVLRLDAARRGGVDSEAS